MIGSINISRKTYWLAGTGLVAFLGVLWLYFIRKGNQDIADNILKASSGTSDTVTTPGGAQYGDSRDLGISQIMNPAYWRSNPSKVSIWAANADGSAGPAKTLAKQLYDAKGGLVSLPKPSSAIQVFRTLKSKEDVSKLADVFAGMYKQDLYTYLTDNNWLSHSCSPEQDECFGGMLTNYLKQIYEIILNLN